MIVIGHDRLGHSDFYLNDSQHDDNDKEEESDIESESPIKIFITRWVKFVTNTTTSSNTSIQMELETSQHIITLEIVFTIFTLIVITTEEIEGNYFFTFYILRPSLSYAHFIRLIMLRY